jgi:hypothetical protein
VGSSSTPTLNVAESQPVQEFKATLLRPIIGDEEMAALLARPAPPFDLLQIQDLLPPGLASQHEALFG